MEPEKPSIVLLLKLSRPYLLTASGLSMLLGTGIARYLNFSISWTAFWIGLLWAATLQLAAQFLHEYFDMVVESDPATRTHFFSGSPVLGSGEGKLPRHLALIAGMFALCFTAALTVTLLWQKMADANTVILMALLLGLSVAFSVPPLRLSRSGFGELTVGIVFGILLPAFSFNLQAGGTHRLVLMTGLPITLLAIPALIDFSFSTYTRDQKYERSNLLQRIGWQNSIVIHHSLILLSFLALAASLAMGYPRSVGMRALLAFPLGLAQMWLMGRVAQGAKPAWQAVRFNAVSMVFLLAALYTLSFWIE